MADEVKRAKAKRAATLRAQFNHKVALERIDFKMNVIDPEMERLDSLAKVGKVPRYELIEGGNEGA